MGFLVRPELSIESLIFVAVVLWLDDTSAALRSRVRILGWAFGLPFLYELFRMGYYGMLFANTAVAKEAMLPGPARGISYFADFVGPYWLFVPVGALLLGAYYPLASALHKRPEQRRSHVVLLAFPVAGAVNALYIIAIGGDYVHARLFMAPLFAFCIPVAAVPVTRRTVLALLVVPWALVCALTFRSADNSPWFTGSFISIDGHGSLSSPSATSDPLVSQTLLKAKSGIYVQFAGPTSIEKLRAAPASDLHKPTLATSWIGPEPYQLGSHVQVVDLLGLADPLTSHMRLVRRGQIAGHEKPLPTPWVAAVLTAPGSSTAQLDALQRQRPGDFTPLVHQATGHKLAVETAWARAALECPAIEDLRSSSSVPLSFGTIVSNIVHAVARTTLRIPPDPETAYHRFCGPGTPGSVRRTIRSR